MLVSRGLDLADKLMTPDFQVDTLKDSLKACVISVATKWQKTSNPSNLQTFAKTQCFSNCAANQVASHCSGAVCLHLHEVLCVYSVVKQPIFM